MRLQRAALALVVAAAMGTAVLPALAKEGMTATLTKKVNLSAPAGSRVKVAWRMQAGGATSAGSGTSDHRIYVRLMSSTGARSTRAWGVLHGRTYTASVKVPRGGIREVEIWLVGYRMTQTETTRADMQIPLTNPPTRASTMSHAGQ